MINETILLLTPYEDCSQHRVAKRVSYRLVLSVPIHFCFFLPLQDMFSRIILYDYWKRCLEVGIEGANQEITEIVRKEQPKYVLWVAIGQYYEVKLSTFDAIRKEGSIVVGWLFDVNIRFHYYSKWLVPYVDYFIVDDREAVGKFRTLGAWATQAICTGKAMELDWSMPKEIHEISFVGRFYGNRRDYIKKIQDMNFPIHLFGASAGKFVTYQEMNHIFSTSKINLNFSMDFKNQKLAIKARIFEVCLAGGFLLTEYFPGIEAHFDLGKEIVCFTNTREMIEKITFYLHHEEERRLIAKAGWERARKEYSAYRILFRVFQEIEEDISNGIKRVPAKRSMPFYMRRRVSKFYRDWGQAFLAENHYGLWKDALALSISYNPLSIAAWFYRMISLLPNHLFWAIQDKMHKWIARSK
ncbi:MAG: glycosyltransferase [Deltaproteobacteria bacterium]